MKIQIKLNKEQLDASREDFDLAETRRKIPGIYEKCNFRAHFYQKQIPSDDLKVLPNLEMLASFQVDHLKKNPELVNQSFSSDLKSSMNQASCEEMIQFFEEELRETSQKNFSALESLKECIDNSRKGEDGSFKKSTFGILNEIHILDPIEMNYINYCHQKKVKRTLRGYEEVEESYKSEWEAIKKTKDLCSNQSYIQKALCQICNRDLGVSETDVFIFCSVTSSQSSFNAYF